MDERMLDGSRDRGGHAEHARGRNEELAGAQRPRTSTGEHDEHDESQRKGAEQLSARPPSLSLLAPADIEALAAALAPWLVGLLADALVGDGRAGPRRYVDAAAVAAHFGVERDWVYAHKDELGALRLGAGRRARLRFDVDRVAAALERRLAHTDGSAPGSRTKPALPRRRGKGVNPPVELIPYEA